MDRSKTALKKFHFIYRTTNLLNGRYYVGLHSTNNVDDDYIGSGTRFWNEVNKYGRENFKREILEFLPSRQELKARERSLVNEDMLKDPRCMNLKLGGEGGWDHVPREIVLKNLSKRNPDWREYNNSQLGRKRSSERMKRLNAEGRFDETRKRAFKGKQHTEETKRAIGEANSKMTGEKNSQFGSKWMNKDQVVKKVKHDEVEQHVQDGWHFGRK